MEKSNVDQTDYIESASYIDGLAIGAHGCKGPAPCRSCGGGCYGCKGSRGADASELRNISSLSVMVKEILD